MGAAGVMLGVCAAAQQRIGSVALEDASVAGALEVRSGQAVLVGASSVTAREHVAELKLERGGVVRVCQTSGLHVTAGAAGAGGVPLMLALDGGAIEVAMASSGSDVILTPDLRFAVKGKGALDLRVRVGQNGDTCVEQRGSNAPGLVVTDSFGEGAYEIHGGQHVMFEHGSLREVVDRESSPCGCPRETMSLAEAALVPGSAAAEHPFPAAQSLGLAVEPAVPQAAPGAVHTEVAATLSFPTAAVEATVAPAPPAAPQAGETPHGFGHAIGHFFRRIFGGG